LLNALTEIADTDPLLRYEVDAVTHEIILSFLGRVQLEIISDLLVEKYQLNTTAKESAEAGRYPQFLSRRLTSVPSVLVSLVQLLSAAKGEDCRSTFHGAAAVCFPAHHSAANCRRVQRRSRPRLGNLCSDNLTL